MLGVDQRQRVIPAREQTHHDRESPGLSARARKPLRAIGQRARCYAPDRERRSVTSWDVGWQCPRDDKNIFAIGFDQHRPQWAAVRMDFR